MGLLTNTTLRRRILLGVGGLFVVVGVALLSFGVYKLVQPGDSTKTENVVDLEGGRGDDLLHVRPRKATPSPTPAPPLGDAPYTMTIDKIGVNAPVRTYGLD